MGLVRFTTQTSRGGVHINPPKILIVHDEKKEGLSIEKNIYRNFQFPQTLLVSLTKGLKFVDTGHNDQS